MKQGIAQPFEPFAPDAQEPQGHSDGPLLLTQIQVCRLLGISDESWRRWRKAGRTPAVVDLPGRPRWRRDEVLALIGQRREESRGPRKFFRHAISLRAVRARG